MADIVKRLRHAAAVNLSGGYDGDAVGTKHPCPHCVCAIEEFADQKHADIAAAILTCAILWS